MIGEPTAQMRERRERREGGIALAIVLILVVLLVTAVYTFQRRAIVNSTIARNRIAAAEADVAARGALRVAEAAVFMMRLQEAVSDASDDPAAELAAAALGAAAVSTSDL